ncbi:hypothetical protein GCM10023094_09420 [Rhodococcus olei]|uniref:Uncharacterized protein n=1 Tax=Rhodococcus olei TaxID=2161675 RepID=A0ABP8NUZ1_9NOCA
MTTVPPDPQDPNNQQPGPGYPPPQGWQGPPPQPQSSYGQNQPQQPFYPPPQQPPPTYPSQYIAGPPARPSYYPKLVVALIASICICIGSLGPWVTIFAISKAGVDGDGVLTLILGAISAVGIFSLISRNGRPKYGDRWAGPVVGALCLFISIPNAFDVADQATEFMGRTVGPSIGWGLWLVMVSAAVVCLSTFHVAQEIGKEKKQQTQHS